MCRTTLAACVVRQQHVSYFLCICVSDCTPVYCNFVTTTLLVLASCLCAGVLVCWGAGGLGNWTSALMHAAANGHFSTVRSLLKRGADARSVGSQVRLVACPPPPLC
jgi:hypothetical protein